MTSAFPAQVMLSRVGPSDAQSHPSSAVLLERIWFTCQSQKQSMLSCHYVHTLVGTITLKIIGGHQRQSTPVPKLCLQYPFHFNKLLSSACILHSPA